MVASTAKGLVGRKRGSKLRLALPLPTRNRRKMKLMRWARHAGTAVSALGFTADLLSQINAISAGADRSGAEQPDTRDGAGGGRGAEPGGRRSEAGDRADDQRRASRRRERVHANSDSREDY